jgi:hypothetical protein
MSWKESGSQILYNSGDQFTSWTVAECAGLLHTIEQRGMSWKESGSQILYNTATYLLSASGAPDAAFSHVYSC